MHPHVFAVAGLHFELTGLGRQVLLYQVHLLLRNHLQIAFVVFQRIVLHLILLNLEILLTLTGSNIIEHDLGIGLGHLGRPYERLHLLFIEMLERIIANYPFVNRDGYLLDILLLSTLTRHVIHLGRMLLLLVDRRSR